MNKKTLIAVTCCLALFLSTPIRVNASAAPPALVSADWSVNAAHNLASNPPSLDTVEDFERRSLGASEEEAKEFGDTVCEFRFADLRSSGNLSLIMTVDGGGTGGCNLFYIFDRTPKGFELYRANARGHDLANSVLDINHDGKHELVLWGDLAPFATGPKFGKLGCDAEWPLIFAWTDANYTDVTSQYKGYYEHYLESLKKQIAASSSATEEAQAPAAARTAAPQPAMVPVPAIVSEASSGSSNGNAMQQSQEQYVVPAPSRAAAPAPTPAPDYDCLRIEAAKTEEFLGIDSDSTMSAAIKDSESTDPNKRVLAAVIFSYLGTQEAEQDLKTLGNDADSRVARIAKETASLGEDPLPGFRKIVRQVDTPGIPTASFMR